MYKTAALQFIGHASRRMHITSIRIACDRPPLVLNPNNQLHIPSRAGIAERQEAAGLSGCLLQQGACVDVAAHNAIQRYDVSGGNSCTDLREVTFHKVNAIGSQPLRQFLPRHFEIRRRGFDVRCERRLPASSAPMTPIPPPISSTVACLSDQRPSSLSSKRVVGSGPRLRYRRRSPAATERSNWPKAQLELGQHCMLVMFRWKVPNDFTVTPAWAIRPFRDELTWRTCQRLGSEVTHRSRCRPPNCHAESAECRTDCQRGVG